MKFFSSGSESRFFGSTIVHRDRARFRLEKVGPVPGRTAGFQGQCHTRHFLIQKKCAPMSWLVHLRAILSNQWNIWGPPTVTSTASSEWGRQWCPTRNSVVVSSNRKYPPARYWRCSTHYGVHLSPPFVDSRDLHRVQSLTQLIFIRYWIMFPKWFTIKLLLNSTVFASRVKLIWGVWFVGFPPSRVPGWNHSGSEHRLISK